jgi:hypothetical protein
LIAYLSKEHVLYNVSDLANGVVAQRAHHEASYSLAILIGELGRRAAACLSRRESKGEPFGVGIDRGVGCSHPTPLSAVRGGQNRISLLIKIIYKNIALTFVSPHSKKNPIIFLTPPSPSI